MHFDKVEILDWVKTAPEAPIDLTSSGMASPEKLSELGIRGDDLPITGHNFYGYKPLREHLAQVYKTSPDCVTISAGASVSNFAVMGVLHSKVNLVTVEEPAYEPFVKLTTAITGTSPERIKRASERQYHIDPNDPLLLDGRPRILLIANPHNPTGIFEKPGTIKKIADRIESDGGWMMIDEVFLPFLKGGDQLSHSHLNDRIVTTCSLTKAWGLSTLRVGWVIGRADVIHDIERAFDYLHVVQPFMTEFIAYHVLCKTDIASNLLKAAHTRAAHNLSIVKGYLDKLPELFYVTPDAGISILVRFKDGRNADDFCDNLEKDYGVRVINGRYFEVPDGFRMSFGVAEEVLRRGLEAITQAVKNS